MTAIQVVGIGLDGIAGLSPSSQKRLQQAEVVVGSARQLEVCGPLSAEIWPLQDFPSLLERLRQRLSQPEPGSVVVLASGDPLFFGIGRLLLQALPPEQISFYPHLSSVQLAFSRIKLPWQDATLVSIHGRDPDALLRALRRGRSPIAVLTDPQRSPSAIAAMVLDLDLPQSYRLWVCENLGGAAERIHCLDPQTVFGQSFDALSVVVLEAQASPLPACLPQLGLPDSAFLSFPDRPGLITKREVRIQILGELGLQDGQVIWDVGAGTGSVSVEIARLLPQAQVLAVEKTAAGVELIRQNAHRFQVGNLQVVPGAATAVLGQLPAPDRVFIGGSGGELVEILDICAQKLQPQGQITLALATLEHQQQVMAWQQEGNWRQRLLQVQLARSVAIADLTRWAPLNPVVLISLWQPATP